HFRRCPRGRPPSLRAGSARGPRESASGAGSWTCRRVITARMLTVHHLNNSRSQRVLWLLEELEVPYEIVKYERDRKTMLAPPELQKIHPLGKSPVITDGALTIAESGAI